MHFTIDKLAPDPLYLQVRDQIVAAIAAKELRAGDQLPSVRLLAEQLEVNLHTIKKAYDVLAEQGYVVVLGRRGAFIADVSVQKSGLDTSELTAALAKLWTDFLAAGGSAAEFLAAAQAATATKGGKS